MSGLFFDWLSNFRVKKGERCSHVGMFSNKGCYYVPDDQREQFLNRYYENVIIKNEQCDIIEKHTELCCLLYDLDLKIPNNEETHNKRAYDEESIKNFIECVTRIVSKYIDTSSPTSFDAFVCEKQSASSKKDCLKDGIHIMFPYIVTESSIQYLIREEILIESKHIFRETINTIEDIVDAAVIERNGWMLYGSKKPESQKYGLTGVWGYDSMDDVGEVSPNRRENSKYYNSTKELIELLSIRRFTMGDIASFKPEMNDFIENWMEDFKQKREEKELSRKFHGDINRHHDVDLNTVKNLVSILSSDRAEKYDLWIELGFCLHNISESLVDTWIEFSQREEKYMDSAKTDCSRRWNHMNNSGLGLGTLHMWAKADNLAAYYEIIQNDLEYFIVKTVCNSTYEKDAKKQNHADIIFHVVSTLKQKYNHFYICTSYDKRIWYEFTGTSWIEDDSDVSLKRKVREDLYNDYSKVSLRYRKLCDKISGEHPNKDKYDMISKEVFKVANRLRDASFRKKVLEEASEQFYWYRERSQNFDSTHFEEILDTQTHLIGLKNGVYDLNTCTFREARCEDYISISTENDYEEYHWTDHVIEEIMEFIKQILPTKAVREYVLQILASFLNGTIEHEHFHMWIGSGGNGKSKLIELFEYAFGRYCSKLSISALTQKRVSSSAPTPEIARLRGKRFVVLQEPNENETLQVGIMKEMTGGDKIVARSLNKEPIEFKPQFKMILTCNQLPKVPSDDAGTWRRIRVVNFTSKFRDNPDPQKPNEFKLDSKLGDKLRIWGKPFFWILTEYWKKLKETGYIEPEEVRLSTNEYKSEQDKNSEFVRDFIDKRDGMFCALNELYVVYSTWYRESNSEKVPSRKVFQKYMESQFGRVERKGRSYGFLNIGFADDENLNENPEDIL